eukprot:6191182-Pleurochrysis_carterae.AAC.2
MQNLRSQRLLESDIPSTNASRVRATGGSCGDANASDSAVRACAPLHSAGRCPVPNAIDGCRSSSCRKRPMLIRVSERLSQIFASEEKPWQQWRRA